MIIFVFMDKDRLIKEYVGGKAISALSRVVAFQPQL